MEAETIYTWNDLYTIRNVMPIYPVLRNKTSAVREIWGWGTFKDKGTIQTKHKVRESQTLSEEIGDSVKKGK